MRALRLGYSSYKGKPWLSTLVIFSVHLIDLFEPLSSLIMENIFLLNLMFLDILMDPIDLSPGVLQILFLADTLASVFKHSGLTVFNLALDIIIYIFNGLRLTISSQRKRGELGKDVSLRYLLCKLTNFIAV